MRKLILTIALSIAVSFSVMAQTAAANKLRSAESMIENFYVDEVDADTLVTEAIKAMLRTLDPHSTYSTPQETKELEEPLQGNFSGIGVTFNMTTDTVYIIQPTVGGPSERVGILPGDRIIMADDTLISGVKMGRNEIMRRLRGPKGTQVKLSILRPGEEALIDFVVTRDDIPIFSVDAAYMVDSETGYIRLTRFAEDTPDEVKKAMKDLSKKGMKQIIIDLQDNGGGYLVASTALADMFLEKGDEVVFTKSSRGNPKYYTTEKTGEYPDMRVVVLVNQYSASASEIFSGAMQDNDRGVIVGRRTYGKGLVQRPFRFSDGSMMRLTISRYHTPSGRCIQKPYTDGGDKGYRDDIAERLKSGELMSADSVHFDKDQLFQTRAGRPVYGGGGIMPDHFVGLDTAFYTPYYRDLVAKGIINKYTIHYVDENREQLKKVYKKDEKKFLDNFTVTQQMLDDMVAMGEKDGVVYKPEEFGEVTRDYVAAVIKAIVGRDMFEQATYYKVMNPLNPIFVEGYNLIKDSDSYKKYLEPNPQEMLKP